MAAEQASAGYPARKGGADAMFSNGIEEKKACARGNCQQMSVQLSVNINHRASFWEGPFIGVGHEILQCRP